MFYQHFSKLLPSPPWPDPQTPAPARRPKDFAPEPGRSGRSARSVDAGHHQSLNVLRQTAKVDLNGLRGELDGPPLKRLEFVHWDDCSQYMGK